MASFYVAGSRHERDEVQAVQRRLKDQGHTITLDWTELDEVDARTVAGLELEAVLDADMLVAVLSPDGLGRGMFVEIGMALGHDIPVHLIGDIHVARSVFWELDLVTHASVDVFLRWVGTK